MNRNELITYLQMQRGMKMASVVYLDGRAPRHGHARPRCSPAARREYFYKVPPGAEVSVGDIWAAQARDTFALVRIVKVWSIPPTGVDLGLTRWKYLVSRVDTGLAQRVVEEEEAVFEQIARIEMQTRMQEISKALGFDVSKVEIPSLRAN